MIPTENSEINLWWLQRNLKKKKKSRKSLIPAERKKEKNKWKGGRRGKVVR